MKRPAVGLALVFAVGIWLGAQVAWPPLWLAGGTLLWLVVWRIRPAVVSLLLAVACAGMASYRSAVTNSAPTDIANLLDRREQTIALHGVIVSAPNVSDNRCSFKLELAALNRGTDWEPARGRVFIFSHQPVTLRYGDEIECAVVLHVPPPAMNPGTFDWQQWLAHQNIQFIGIIRKGDSCRVLASGRGQPVTALALRLRDRFERALRLGLENEPAVAGALAAVVIGKREEIPPDTYAEFQQTGVFHVFAINGLHVGLVTAVVVLLLRLLRVPRRWTAVPAIPLLVLYVFATGAHPGAMRALVMVCVWLIGGMLVRPVDLLSSLATAAVVILVWNPVQLFDGGFVLSFAVVTALATLTDKAAWWKLLMNPDPTAAPAPSWLGWLRPDPLVPRALVPGWQLAVTRVVAWLALLAGGSLAAWLGLVPLMAMYFHLFTPVSIVANLLVIPLLSGVIALGLASTVAHAVWPWLTLTFNNANFFVLGGILHGIAWLSRWPWGHWFVQAPPVWLTVSYYTVLLVWMVHRFSRRLKLRITSGAVAVAAVILWMQHEEVVEVTVLDLRDGMAVFVNLPGEQHDFLVDGGSSWSGARVVVPFLRAQGVDRLAALVLTRGDKAHAAGLTAVASAVPVRQVIYAGTGAQSKYFWEWFAAVRRQRLEVVTLRAGADWQVAGKFRWRVLNPPAVGTYRRSDDNSLVLLLEYGPTRVLLASDIGQSVEHQLVASNADLHAQVLVKGRHSTEPTGSDEFLDAVQPAVVVQAVGTEPSSRYLEPALRDRLRQRQIPLYRTDETGAVTIRLKRTGYEIRTCATGRAQPDGGR